jgi:hypothetical protein
VFDEVDAKRAAEAEKMAEAVRQIMRNHRNKPAE